MKKNNTKENISTDTEEVFDEQLFNCMLESDILDSDDSEDTVFSSEPEILLEPDAEPSVEVKPTSDSKHKEPGKHALKGPYRSLKSATYNIVKIDPNLDIEYDSEDHPDFYVPKMEKFDIHTKHQHSTSESSWEDSTRLNEMRKTMHQIIIEKTDIDVNKPRRKPRKIDFNNNFELIVKGLDMEKFSHSEVFMEFAFYFSENTLNMFKLLDPVWGAIITDELVRLKKMKINDYDFE